MIVTTPSFLCRSSSERGRLVDMRRRLRWVEPIAVGLPLLAMLAGVGTFGWAAVSAAALATIVFLAAPRLLPDDRRPELVAVAALVATQLCLATAIVVASGGREYLLPTLVVPMVLVGVLFPARVTIAGIVFTSLLIVGVGLGFDRAEVLASPPVLYAPILVLVVFTLSAVQIRNLDADTRSTVVVDRLTGLLNRAALAARAGELTHQAAVTGEPVAVIVADVDHFKAINDRHGHASGDSVLKEVAARLRGCVGSFEPIYRLGGEEFMLLLAGTDAAGATAAAQRLRRAVSERPVLDLDVTMSLGVAASEPGQPFDFEAVFARADAALYEAKRAGRDRVRGSQIDTPGPTPSELHSASSAGRRPGASPELVPVAGPGVASWRERIARQEAEAGSWLVRDEIEREHLLELNRRLRSIFAAGAAIAFVGITVAAPWYGWLTLVPPIIVAIGFNAMVFKLERLRRPEYALAIGWIAFQASICAGFCLSTGAPLFALYLFMIMVISATAIFPARGAIVGVASTAVFMTIAAVDRAPHLVTHHPAVLLLPLAGLVGVGAIGWAVGQSAVDHRSAAVVDHLTGLLNRTALEARTAELSAQSAQTGEPVAVIVTDLDRFKAVNDHYGHAVGDIVLREAAYRIRKCLRAFESAYRFGGEEFVILLAGVDEREAADVAERLWNAVRCEPISKLGVTVSVGVAASAAGGPFDYATVFAHADAALLEAKRSGRDRVRVHAATSTPVTSRSRDREFALAGESATG